MYTIHLHQLEFFSFHGIYEEERILGNNYIVNVDVDFEFEGTVITIDDTIDYTTIYDIVKKCMKKPTRLIEIVAEEIAAGIHIACPIVKRIKISIQKSNPPVKGFIGNVAVSLQKHY